MRQVRLRFIMWDYWLEKIDISLLEETKEGRNINRHYYTEEEIGREVERPVVKQLLELMKLRNTHPAFDGEFYMLPCEKEQLILGWKKRRQQD